MTMFKNKREIDAHVHDILSKVNNQSEKVIRSFAIARMYYDHQEYLEARKYLEAYLSMHRKPSDTSEANKLMGEILYNLGDMDGALENYKNSFRANGKCPRDTLNRICDLMTDGYGVETPETRQKWFDLQKKEVNKTPKLYSTPNLMGVVGGTPSMREINHYYVSPKVYNNTNNNITTTPPSSNNTSAINGHLTSTPKRYSNTTTTNNGYTSPSNTSYIINNNKDSLSLNNSFSTPNSKSFLEKMARIVEQNEKILNQNERLIDVVSRLEDDVKELKISKNFETTPSFIHHNCSGSCSREKITTATTPTNSKKELSTMSGSTLFANLGSSGGAKNAITFGEVGSKSTPPSAEVKFGIDFSKGFSNPGTTTTPVSGLGSKIGTSPSVSGTNLFSNLAKNENAPTFAALANTTSDFKFGIDSSKGFPNSGAPVFGSKLGSSIFGNTSVSVTTAEKDDEDNDGGYDDDGRVEDYEPDVTFQPIYPLPPLIEVKKGVENENLVFEHRIKLLRYDPETKEWKERGVGNIKILQHEMNRDKVRIIMWREQVLKLACNHFITTDMIPEHVRGNQKTLIWTAFDYSDGEPRTEVFVARFGTEEKCLEFKSHFIRFINEIATAPAPTSNDSSIKAVLSSPKLTQNSPPKNIEKIELTTKSTPPKSQESTAKNPSSEFKFGFNFTTPSSGTGLFSDLSKNTPSFADLATTKNAPTFADLASKNSTSDFKFGIDFSKGFANSGAPVFGNIGAGTSVFGNTSVNEKDDDEADGDGEGKFEEYEPDVQFKPIYPLPPLIDVKKGDENENVVFEHRAKILRFDSDVKEWKERGVGNIKILQHKENKNKARIVMWREQVFKLACNHYITAEMVPEHFKENKKTLMWTAYDYSDEEPDNEIFVVRFGTEEKCLEFKNHFLQLINEIATTPTSSNPTNPTNKEVLSSPQLTQDLTPKKNEESTTKSTPPKSQESITKNSSSEFKFGFDFTKGLTGSRSLAGSTLFSDLTKNTPTFADLATTKNAPTFGDLASKNSTSDFKFGIDFSKGFANSGAPVFGNIGAGTSIFGNTSVTEKDDEEAEGGDGDGKFEEYEPDVTFKPIYPLPPLIDVKKGDENENVVFEHRAKILRFDSDVKEWKERGVGNIKILQHKENKNKVRIIMWREQVLKLACNHYITAEMTPEHFKENKKTLMWTAYDFSDEEPDNEIFVVRFGTEEKCLEFKNHFLRLIEEISTANASGSPATNPNPTNKEVLSSPQQTVDLTPPKINQKSEESPTKSTPPKSQESTTKNSSPEFKFGLDFTKGLTGSPSLAGSTLFSDLTKNAPTFADLASKNTTSDFKFGIDFSKGFANSGAPVFGNIGAGTSVFGNTSVTEKDDDEVEGDGDGKAEDYEPDVTFKPIYPLPPLIDVKKGDENENVVFEHRAKILRFDSYVKEWKERGVGNIKILQHKENKNKARIIMWREQVLKLACNHYITAEMTPEHFKENKKTLMWTAYDFSDEEPDNEIFVVRFGTEEKCLEFKDHFLRLINEIATAPTSNDSSIKEVLSSPKLTQDLTPKNNEKVVDSTATTISFSPKSTPPKPQETPSSEFKFGFDFTKGLTGSPSLAGSTLFSDLTKNTPTFADLASTKNAPTFADLASKNTTSEFKFGIDFSKGFANSGAPVFGNIGAGTSVFGNTSVTEKDDEEVEGDGDGKVDEYEPDVIFKPIYPLPPLIDVKKGDENENVVFEHRAKILRFDSDVKEWKERGVGNIKILQHKENKNKARIIMWREQVLKLACNHYITAEMTPEHCKENKKTLMWTAYDYSDEEPDNEIFVVRFGTEEKCLEFKNHFLRLINEIKGNTTGGCGDNVSVSTPSAQPSVVSESEIEIIFEKKLPDDLISKANSLNLPPNFFSYEQENFPGCAGCRGCDPDAFVFPIVENGGN